MSYPALEDWFSLSIRRNRKSFIVATVALAVTALVIAFVTSWFRPSESALTILLIIFGVPFVICSYLLSAQRLRDMGVTGWLRLLWIPVNLADTYVSGAASLAFWIVLCTVPGTAGQNRYGPDPLAA